MRRAPVGIGGSRVRLRQIRPSPAGIQRGRNEPDGVWRLAVTTAGLVCLAYASCARGCRYIDSSLWKNERYRLSAIRRSSVDT